MDQGWIRGGSGVDQGSIGGGSGVTPQLRLMLSMPGTCQTVLWLESCAMQTVKTNRHMSRPVDFCTEYP